MKTELLTKKYPPTQKQHFVPQAHHANSITTSMKKNLLYNSENLFLNPSLKKNAIGCGRKINYLRLHIFEKMQRKKTVNCAASLAMILIYFSLVCIFSHTFGSRFIFSKKSIQQNKIIIQLVFNQPSCSATPHLVPALLNIVWTKKYEAS